MERSDREIVSDISVLIAALNGRLAEAAKVGLKCRIDRRSNSVGWPFHDHIEVHITRQLLGEEPPPKK